MGPAGGAGEDAAALYANTEAATFYRRALDAAPRVHGLDAAVLAIAVGVGLLASPGGLSRAAVWIRRPRSPARVGEREAHDRTSMTDLMSTTHLATRTDTTAALADDGACAMTLDLTIRDLTVEQGSRGELIYVVESGEIEILREQLTGPGERLASIGPGDDVGELGPLLGFPRSATARAHTDVTLTAYGVDGFRRIILSGGGRVARPPFVDRSTPGTVGVT